MARKAKRRTYGAVRRLPSGKYQARVLDPGSGKLVSIGTYETSAEADARIAGAQTDQRRGGWVDPRGGEITVAEYARAWLRDHASLRPRTRETYRGLLELHIVPTLGNYELGGLTTPVIRHWQKSLRDGKSPGQAPKAYRLLNTIYNTAVAEDRLVARNPCSIAGAGKERSEERPTATVEQVWLLADSMPNCFRLFVLIAGFVGLRLGELQGLRRHHIDLDALTVNIQEQIQELADGTFYTGEPKTEAGKRLVDLPAFLLPELQAHLATFAQPGPDGLLFPGRGGGPFRRMTLYRAFNPAKVKAGLPGRFVVHDLRHTANTLSVQAGASTKEAMVQMGHSTADAALRYQHATRERLRVVADLVNGFVVNAAPAQPSNVVPLPRAIGDA